MSLRTWRGVPIQPATPSACCVVGWAYGVPVRCAPTAPVLSTTIGRLQVCTSRPVPSGLKIQWDRASSTWFRCVRAGRQTRRVVMCVTAVFFCLQRDRREHVVMIASEPLNSMSDGWLEVPRNHLLRVRCRRLLPAFVVLLRRFLFVIFFYVLFWSVCAGIRFHERAHCADRRGGARREAGIQPSTFSPRRQPSTTRHRRRGAAGCETCSSL